MPDYLDHKELFKVARAEFHRSTMKIKVGCAIADEIGLLGMGHNEFHEVRARPPYSIHAEIAALIASLNNGHPNVVYVYRETRTGIIADSKPCKWCQITLKKYGVEYVHYTSREGPHFRKMVLR